MTTDTTKTQEIPAAQQAGTGRAPDRKVIVLTMEGGKAFRLDKGRIVLGSVVSADVRLGGDGVAPLHAVIEGGGAPAIYDLASETGVFVNGAKVITHALRDGDRITIGHHALVFSLQEFRQESPKEWLTDSAGRALFVSGKEDFASLLLEDENEVEQIFDFRPANKRAVEVVMSWNEVILDVEHFVDERAIVLGSDRKCHFSIPPLLQSQSHPVVTREGESYSLRLDPRMGGVVQRQGALRNIQDLHASGAGAQVLPFEKDDFAKLTIGDLCFYLSFTAAPPRLKRGRLLERDPFFLKIFGASMLLTAVTVVSLMNATVPQQLEAEQLPERIATILYQPQKYVPRPVSRAERVKEPAQAQAPVPVKPIAPPPKPVAKLDIKPNPNNVNKPVPKEMHVAQTSSGKQGGMKSGGVGSQNQAKEGQGARAKGKEGTRGSPKGPKVAMQPQSRALRPSPQGGAGRGDGNSEIPDIGNVDLLKDAGGKIENILGNSAAKLGKGGEKLKGFGGFNTLGTDGLALSGSGKGGGGTADSLGGLGTQGRGGGRVGTGLGAAGNGSGIVGGQSRVVIRSGGPEETVVMGMIDADAVEAALLAHRDEFRLCYEEALKGVQTPFSGRVGTSFVIGSSGKVNQAGIQTTTLKQPVVEQCILKVIRRIQFPIPRGAGLVQVTYPFKFIPTGG